MVHSQTMFQNAHDFTVIDSQFFSANRMIFNNVSDNDPVATTLWQNVAAGAMFDSAERFPPAKCHPGTRERMIEKIAEWIENPTPNQRILWLYGPAGSGKSALAHTICERYRDRCKGSFFFARGLTDRGKAFKLFATLSYQLALQFPSMRAALNEALHRDPSLPTKSMEAQLFSLIIQPLLGCTPLPEHSPILIIDGLDECADDQGMDTQSSIITLISKAIIEYNIPLRFLIASRPESWIRDTFECSPLPNITLSLSLRDDIDADKDIKAYLMDGFEKIRMENKRIMESVTLPWPPTKIVERFVYEASGQYIYASTVLKFVGNSSRHSDPEEQLRILISPGPDRVLAFSELDRLYERIVSAYPGWATMKRVLGGILVDANSTTIEKILGVEPREYILVMDALSPLIDVKVPGPLSHYAQLLEPIYGSLTAGQDEISLCHLSFREFLEDESRSGAFHIDVQQIFQEIAQSIFGIIIGNIAQNYTTEPNVSFNIGLATYQKMMSNMVYGCLGPKVLSDMQLSDLEPFRQLIVAMTQSLFLLKPDLEMDHFGCFMADMEILEVTLSEFSHSPIVKNQPDKVADFIHVISELKQAASHARKRWIHMLTSAKRFRVTPTLAYLYQFHPEGSAPVDTIFNLGHPVTDIISSLQQHRHIITIWLLAPACLLSVVHLSEDLDDDGEVDEGWRTRGEWRHQRISIVSQKLNVTFDPRYDDGWYWSHFDYLGEFFMSRNLTDIQTSKYFQNPCNLSILSLLTNFSVPASWLNVQAEEWHQLARFIVPVLCWFNRQLTNTTTLELLESHDQNLVPTMRATMKQIFDQYFLPNHSRSYHSELSFTTGDNNRSIKMTVLPLPQGYRQEESSFVHNDTRFPFYWRGFHDEILGNSFRTQLGRPPTSDDLLWHPYLASYLLNSLAKDLYRRINPDFQLLDRPEEQSKESFAYIVECLPYAETTQQNLDSLRAIAYFFSQVNLEWDPPIEFWYLSVEFLKKYDRSVLSADELNQFEWWMYSMGRYMKRYRPVAPQEPAFSF